MRATDRLDHRLDHRLDEAALARLSEAVAAAEARTAGEIVTTVVGECDSYPEAPLRAALLGGMMGLGVWVFLVLGGSWGLRAWAPVPWWSALLPVLLALLAAVAVRGSDGLRRLLLDRDRLDERVQRRAEAAFLEEEVFATRERTGVLLFVALFEHRVVVLGDVGIYTRVPNETWQGIVARSVAGIRGGDLEGSLQRAIEECGELLESRGIERRPDDSNELGNAPRLRER